MKKSMIILAIAAILASCTTNKKSITACPTFKGSGNNTAFYHRHYNFR